MNNKECKNCNSINNNEAIFCYNCGTKFKNTELSESNLNINKQLDDENKIGNTLAIISLILFYASSSFMILLEKLTQNGNIGIIQSLVGLFPLTGIVTMIYGRIKYPKNKALKITMWLFISTIIIWIVLFIIVTVTCLIAASNFNTSGCG